MEQNDSKTVLKATAFDHVTSPIYSSALKAAEGNLPTQTDTSVSIIGGNHTSTTDGLAYKQACGTNPVAIINIPCYTNWYRVGPGANLHEG